MLAQVKEVDNNGVTEKILVPLTSDVGAGAPVGTIIAQYKKADPEGYLYLDGSTFDADQYPALYMYLGTNTLPDYREFALVGAEQNTHDTIADHDVYTQGQGKDDQLQTHVHAMGAAINAAAGSSIGAFQGTQDTGASTKAISTGRTGTVTRGKRKAVFFYIKATAGLAENQQENVLNTINTNNSYSTSEQPTGAKWIDGKPIYKKTVDTGALPNASTKNVAHNISNLAFVISINGIAKTGNVYIPLPLISSAGKTSDIGIYLNGNNISIESGSDRSSFTTSYVTLEYTKS